jgi:DNA-binding NtrC family response regulator
MKRLCLVEDDEIMGESLAVRFRLEGFDVRWHRDAESADQALSGDAACAVVCDIHLPGIAGDRWFESLCGRCAVLPPFIFITGHGDLGRAVELLKLGAADYVTKPFDIDRLLLRVRELAGEVVPSPDDAPTLGVSRSMQRLEQLLVRLAPLDSTVLITGETGTGKEVVARRLHALSGRSPFVAVNCAALVENLAESELFGHERGAFTGAARTHAGVFERANGGTVFLDEIGDMPLNLQTKLLRVLQDREVVRVGGSQPIAANARVVLATHQDLAARVVEGRFREDLYYRIDVVRLHIPPLRERPDDIPWLAQRLLDECARRGGRPKPGLGPDVERRLGEHPWPGNVRELKHTLERACIFADGPRLRASDLFATANAEPSDAPDTQPLDSYLSQCEKRYIEDALRTNAGRVGVSAEKLGISRKSLWERMRRLAIGPRDAGEDKSENG